jgi:hypothetical protein
MESTVRTTTTVTLELTSDEWWKLMSVIDFAISQFNKLPNEQLSRETDLFVRELKTINADIIRGGQ